MKSLVLFEDSENGATFFELEGDARRFHEVYINASAPEGEEAVHTSDEYVALQEELSDLMFTDEGELKLDELEEPTRDWTFFVRCGILA